MKLFTYLVYGLRVCLRCYFRFLISHLRAMTSEEIIAVGSIFCQPGEFTVVQDGECTI